MDWLCAKWRGSIVVRYRKNEWIAAKRTLRVATLLCPGANTLGAKGRGRSKGKIKIHDGSVCRRRLKCPVQSLETFAQRTQPRDPEAGNIPRGSLQAPAESSYAAGLVRPFSAFSLNLKSTLRMAEMMKPAAIASRPIPRDDWVGSLLEGNKWCQKNKRLFVVPR